MLDDRFQVQKLQCEVAPLSDFIEQENVSRIDLLKIDVQKCEVEVLEGLREEDWAIVQQIVMEIHDIGDRLAHVTALCKNHGFDVHITQDELYVGSPHYNLHAKRRQAQASVKNRIEDIADKSQKRISRMQAVQRRRENSSHDRRRGKRR